MLFKNKDTCLFYALRESRLMRKAHVNHQIKLFFGASHDSLALHMYIYLPIEDLTTSFVPSSSVKKESLVFSLLRVFRFFFPFSGHVVSAKGDFYRPTLFHDFHCKSIVLRSFNYGRQ